MELFTKIKIKKNKVSRVIFCYQLHLHATQMLCYVIIYNYYIYHYIFLIKKIVYLIKRDASKLIINWFKWNQ